MDPRTNDGLGRRSFSVVRTLGEGAFGSVFLADMVSAGGFKRRVALKLLNSSWDPESDAGRRLRDEARLLGRLQHRHIVRVDDLLQLGGRWALLMEYIAGLDVETLISRAKASGVDLPPRAMLQICAATAAALDAAFAAVADDGTPLFVVHRDIKPSNVRLSQTGEVKVLDFGVARADFAGREAKTERVRYGSLGYMAPERVLGEPETAAGDVYSLGVMLYELLTLESYGRAELAPDKQVAQVKLAVARVQVIAGDEIAAIVSASLAYDGAERPSAKEMEGVLRRSAAKLPGDDVEDFAMAKFGGLAVEAGAAEPDPAEGMVLEEGTAALQMLRTGSVSGPTAVVPLPPHSQSPTLAVADLTPLPLDLPDAPTPARSPVMALAVAAGLLLVLLVAGLAWQAQRGRTDAADPVVAGPVPAAPVVVLEGPVTGAGSPPPEGTVSVVLPVVPQVAAPAPTSAPVPDAATPVASVAGTKPRATTPAVATAAAPAATPEPAMSSSAATTRLRAAKFVLTGGSAISVTCGDVTASGVSNALVREFPAGNCSVGVDGHKTTVSLEAPRQVNCTLAGDALSCQ